MVDSAFALDLLYSIVFHVHVDEVDIENKKNHWGSIELKRRKA